MPDTPPPVAPVSEAEVRERLITRKQSVIDEDLARIILTRPRLWPNAFKHIGIVYRDGHYYEIQGQG